MTVVTRGSRGECKRIFTQNLNLIFFYGILKDTKINHEVTMNPELLRFYSSTVKKLEVSEAAKEKLSAPLLLSASAAYEDNPGKRLLVVGQETHGWGSFNPDFWNFKDFIAAENGFEGLLMAYSKFVGESRLGNTPFWRGLQAVAGVKRKQEIPGVPVLWSNLMAADFEGKSFIGKLSAPEQEAFIEFSKKKFLGEFEILKPKACALFTGPDYDFVVKRFLDLKELPAAENDVVSFEWNGCRFFRTYHPGYLQWQRKWGVVEDLAEKVKEILE